MKILNYLTISCSILLFGFVCFSCKGDGGGTGGSGGGKDTTDTVIPIAAPNCPQKSLLYMDISTSMKGYLGTGDSRFRGVVSEYLLLSQNDTKVSLFGLKAEPTISANEFKKILDEQKVKWAGESNLSSMLDSMVNNKSYDVCYLLTDGILSGSNYQISYSKDSNIEHRQELANEIKSLFRGHNDLSALIVRYMANFDGNYFCYNNQSIKLNKIERPFYVIAIGKSHFIKYIERELANPRSNVFDQKCTHYAIYGDQVTYNTLKFSHRRGVKSNSIGELIIDGSVSNKDENIQLSCPVSDLTPDMQTEAFWKKNIELFVKSNEKDSERPIQADSIEILTQSSGKSICVLTINARRLKGRQLTINTRFAHPKWIDEMTDENDLEIGKNPFKQNQTFNLRYFAGGFTALNNSEYMISQTLKFK